MIARDVLIDVILMIAVIAEGIENLGRGEMRKMMRNTLRIDIEAIQFNDCSHRGAGSGNNRLAAQNGSICHDIAMRSELVHNHLPPTERISVTVSYTGAGRRDQAAANNPGQIASKPVYGATVTGHALFPLCRPRLFIMAQSHQFTHESGRIKEGHWEDARRTIGVDLVVGPCNSPLSPSDQTGPTQLNHAAGERSLTAAEASEQEQLLASYNRSVLRAGLRLWPFSANAGTLFRVKTGLILFDNASNLVGKPF